MAFRQRHMGILTTLLLIGATILAACGNSSSTTSSTSGGVVHLTFWAYNDVTDQCNFFNATHPNIQVTCIRKPSSNNAFIPPLLSAIKAGNGPDIALIEYMFIPTLLSNNGLVDISKYVNDTQSQFDPGAWGQVQYGSAVYGLPQDTGQMELYYNAKVYAKAGITSPPTTWADFATDAAKIHALGPNYYITAFDPSTDGWFQSFFWQSGAIWFSLGADGKTWTVNINSAKAKTVAEYWQNLVKQGLVDTAQSDGDFSGGWGKKLDDGTISSWIAPVWGSSVIKGNAADQSGNWAIATIPQSNAGDNATSMWGGSGISVINDTQHPAEAAEFVKWYLTDSNSQHLGVTEFGWFSSNLASRKANDATPDTYFAGAKTGGQTVADGIVDSTGTLFKVDSSWRFVPVLTDVDNAQNDGFSAAIANGTSFDAVLDDIQAKTVAALKAGGYTVAP